MLMGKTFLVSVMGKKPIPLADPQEGHNWRDALVVVDGRVAVGSDVFQRAIDQALSHRPVLALLVSARVLPEFLVSDYPAPDDLPASSLPWADYPMYVHMLDRKFQPYLGTGWKLTFSLDVPFFLSRERVITLLQAAGRVGAGGTGVPFQLVDIA